MIPRDRLQKGLEKFFGLKEFRPGQFEIINSVMSGFDTLAVMPTGGGKSICYQLPALLNDGLTLVITPLISLMRDQVAQINRNGLIATQLDSSLELDAIQERMRLVGASKVKLLYVAPERLGSKRFLGSLSSVRISLVAVDEAHCISQWGHDFRPHYTRISEFLDAIGFPTVLALTATATPDVQDDIVAQLKMRDPRVYISGFARENLSFRVLVESGKTQSILKFIKSQDPASRQSAGIVYAATRKSVDEIHDLLNANGIKALRYHAGLTGEERTKSQMEFLNSNRVMVATNAFGMGINKSDVRYIIHYEIPGTLEAYYQEAGRAGRDGKLSECILLFHQKDLGVQTYFIDSLYPEREEFTRAYNSILDSFSIHVGDRSETNLTVDASEIAGRTRLNSRKIESVVNILARSNVIQLAPNASAAAHIRSKVDMDSFKRAIDRTSSHDTRLILETILRLFGSSVFLEPQTASLEELSHKSDLDASTVNRTLSILQRSGILEYKPPSEGITFKMLERRTDRLPVNFQQLSLLRERAHQRLEQMVEYARTTSCRTNFILDYFGAEEIESGCGNCDNCTINKTFSMQGSEGLPSAVEIYRTILSLVKETQGRYGRSTYCKILLEGSGKLAEELRPKFSGALNQLPPQVVFAAFDFLLSREYLVRMKFINPTVSITEEGKKYLQTGISIPAKKQFKFRKALYKALRDERLSLSKELSLPVFAVVTDEDLIQIANARPSAEEEIVRYLPRVNSRDILRRLLQVCSDFAPSEKIHLPENERRIYELYLEKLTAAEIASLMQLSLQNVIDVFDLIKSNGYEVNFKNLIEKKRFKLITSQLEKTRNPVDAHAVLPDCELAEVILVSRVLSVSLGDRQP
ncbi:MAG TPA: RecQ family ATP-dependent DNA helicase [Candidatus Acidoferrales bacterium]|nr:RecQ family ATP-dependent DNA helicase [Candidatus Acidoferrales bacterium]